MEAILDSLEKVEKKHGGARNGAGAKKGAKPHKIKVREIEIQYIRDRVSAAKDKLVNAQIHLATGVSFLYCIHTNKKGIKEKPRLIETQQEIESYLAGEFDEIEDDYYYIATEKPENPAIMGLLDRILGKPMQAIEHSGPGGKDITFVVPAMIGAKHGITTTK